MKLCKSLLLGLAVCATNAFAAEEMKEDQISEGYDLYLGLGAAGVKSEAKDGEIESDKEGTNLNGEILLNYYKPSVSFDLGLGWLYSNVKGELTDTEIKYKVNKDTIKQRIGYIVAGVNYRWNESLELGLITRTLIGKDASYSPFEKDEKSSVTYVGAQILKTFRTGDNYFRIGPQMMTDINEKDRQVTWIGLSAQMGIPLSNKKMQPQVKVVEKIVEKEKIVEVAKSTIVLDPYLVNFETAKGEPTKDDSAFINEVGALLSANVGKWQSITVEGHSDPRGPKAINDTLSVERANKVKNLLIKSGVDFAKVETVGKGSSEPLVDNKSNVGLARNRRAEVILNGVKDEQLVQKLNEIKKKYEVPGTCAQGACK